jgi:GNAT superfamily N-acetyltransferase
MSRLTAYYRRNGLAATARRTALSARRSLFDGGSQLFYCDLSKLGQSPSPLPASSAIEPIFLESQLSDRDLQQMTSFWHPPLARRRIRQRFKLGAHLWLAKIDGNLAGFGWTLEDRTVEPHYFRLRPGDVHLFDFHVFPQHRGHGINPLLVTHILYRLPARARGRAFIECARWNRAQLASLSKTPFHPFGHARMVTFLGRSLVFGEAKPPENGNSASPKKPVASSPGPSSPAVGDASS